MSISTLPDNVLLEIFVFHRNIWVDQFRVDEWKWHSLVHVCRRWRQIIFTSPNRLDLQILCTPKTPVRTSLGIWPAFPITIICLYQGGYMTRNDEDNLIAALEQADRVRNLGLNITDFQLVNMIPAMQGPSPVLMHLRIAVRSDYPLHRIKTLPADFLGGYAPCLQEIYFEAIAFPALPTLLLSASDLVTLKLHSIPPNGYFSPQVMVASLAVLPRLKDLVIQFTTVSTQLDLTYPPPPITRAVLPALTSFEFDGSNEYLEVLVAPIDGAQLSRIRIKYLHHSLDFPATQFLKFFDRSISPDIIPFTLATVHLDINRVTFYMYRDGNTHPSLLPDFSLSCLTYNWEVTLMAQVFSQFSTILSNVAHLSLDGSLQAPKYYEFEGTGVEWLHFSRVQALLVSRHFAKDVALALENITGEMIAKAWPSLDSICLVGQPTSSIEKFIAARQLSGRPVTVCTKMEFEQRVRSYVRDC